MPRDEADDAVDIRKLAAAARSATALLASERPSEDPVAPTPGGRSVAGSGAGPAPEHPQPAAQPAEAPVLTMHDQSGKLLAVGDAVEARYKGKGTRYYKGKIVDIHADGAGAAVASIDYDDGDKETSAKGENIRLLHSAAPATAAVASASDTGSGSRRASITATSSSSSDPAAAPAPAAANDPAPALSSAAAAAPAASATSSGAAPAAEAAAAPAAPLTSTDLSGAVIGVGDAIEARYKGKGTRFYKGKIVAAKPGANGAVLFAIDYDDGDKEFEARGEYIRLLKKAEPAPPADDVTEVKAAPVPAAAAEPAAPASVPAAPTPAVGTPSASASDATAPKPATSATDAAPATVPAATVPAAAAATPGGVDEAGKPLGVGDVVEAKFKGRSKRYYKGVIAGVVMSPEGDYRFTIDYDDGDKETGARGENIRLLQKAEGGGAPAAATASTSEAGSTDPVAPPAPAATAGSGASSTAAVAVGASAGASSEASTTNSDGAGNVAVAAPSPAAPLASGAGTASQPASSGAPAVLTGKDQSGAEIAVGDAISARYKGKGTRYYEGVIVGARAGPDGAVVFAIRYDDGDAEDGALGVNIRLKQKRASPPSAATAAVAAPPTDATPAAAAVPCAKPVVEAATGKDDLIEEDVDSDADSGPDTKPKPAVSNNNSDAEKPVAANASTSTADDAGASAAGSARPASATKRPQSATRSAASSSAANITADAPAVAAAPTTATTTPAAASAAAATPADAARDGKPSDAQQAKPTISAAAAGSTSGNVDATKQEPSGSTNRTSRGDGTQGSRSQSSPRGHRRGRSSSYDRRDGRRHYDDDRDDDGSYSGDRDDDYHRDDDGYDRRGSDRYRRQRHAPRRRSMDHPDDRYSEDDELDGDRAGSRSRAGGRSRYRNRRDDGGDDDTVDAAGGSAHRHRSASSGVAGRPPIADPHASFVSPGSAYFGGPAGAGPPTMAAGGSGDMFTVSAGTPMTGRPPVFNTGAPGFAAGSYGPHSALPPHASPMGSVHGLGGGLLPSPAAMSYPYAHLGAPSTIAGGPFGAGVAPPLPPPVAAFGRLCRELAAVRARLTPSLFDCYTAQAQARAAAADPYFSGGRVVPAPGDVERWLAAAIRRAAVVLRDPVNACNDEVASTAAVRDGFAACGCPLSRDALAVLRSAFRMRPEYASDIPFSMLPSVVHSRVKAAVTALHRAGGLLAPAAAASPAGGRAAAVDASGEKEHAAVLVTPLAAFLTCDEATSSALLVRMDAFAQKRSGRARPPMPGAGASMMMATPGGAYDGYAGDGAGPLPPAFHTPHVALPSPMTSPSGMAAAAGMMSMLSVGASPPSAAPAATPMTASVGDFMRTHATHQEKEHLLALLATLQEFQRRTGVPQVALAGGARGAGGALADGSDSLIISLGPRLQVGVRFYVS